MSSFDAYAAKYGATVDAAISLSGEDSRYFARLKAELVAARLADIPHPKVLDFGCGVGQLTAALLDISSTASVTGYDPSSESIAQAREAFQNQPRAQFVQGTGGTIPVESSRYDALIAACVLHHIERPDHRPWLSEFRRVLRPGGRLLVFEHNPLNPLTRRAVAACPFDEGVELLPPRYLAPLLREEGFTGVTHSYYFFFPRVLAPLRGLEPLLSRIPLGAQYCMQAVAGAPAGG